MQGAQKHQERGVYRNTLSDEVCSATPQMTVFQQPASGYWQTLNPLKRQERRKGKP
jgi:hypothetical protein